MSDIPIGVLLLYTQNTRPYTITSYSTTAREFVPDPILHPRDRAFHKEAPLLYNEFQVDKKP